MTYKISKQAKVDLARIYWRGVREFGEVQAEKYYNALIERFESIAESPLVYPRVDHVRRGIDAAYVAQTTSIIRSMTITLRLCAFLVARIL